MVDCSLFYERELKRELFGYVSAGARGKSRKGLLEFASNGTCYLSRVEELSLGIQASLLDFVRSGRFPRLGDGKLITSGVRLVASSAKNLSGFVEAGLFDPYLYAQLSKLSARLSPLRDRRDDVPAIVEHFSSVYAADHPGLIRPLFSPEALQALQAYPWPGNLDELEKEVKRLLESSTGTIRPEQLTLELSSYWLGQRGDPEVRKTLEELDGYIREFRVLSRLDLSYVDLLHASSGSWLKLGNCDRDMDLTEEP